ncbi:P-loop containing nucleoside triphosphate hydrolase protein [Sparassis crispa]|uniref:P-loop containing nucleoside triphosphate hydrolase protein n=1 Tax=Sparassis crispa TaxID=139825 RepID=A0A401GGB9_9APHY|nr:P-loop containing nucleoside triphosphate hydrolase protein [Sparassis crispa]GBE81234.1 P-loop containing nucleoside triphosphate hydrolase protein [Sparassis crispa]
MQTRSRTTVLGKRPHQVADPEATSTSQCDQTSGLPTPDSTPNPKRVRTTVTQLDGDSNKENIPPFVGQVVNPSPRSIRSLRRTSTESISTPRPRGTLRRHASTSNLRATPQTQATALNGLSLTPPSTPPSFSLPIHVRAKGLLRPTCNSVADIAGRHTERAEIRNFIASFFTQNESSSEPQSTLYISGSPGTGKTALVNVVLQAIQPELADHDIRVISVNCMALSGVDALWERIAEELSADAHTSKRTRCAKKGKETADKIVERILSLRKPKCVLLLDELDHIGSSQSLSSLFTLAQTYSSNIRMIGIANTHTLTSASSTSFSLQSVKGVKTLHFAPYTPQELMEILTARLSPLSAGDLADAAKKFLPVPTLTLLTKKVAAQTGDVRAVFEVLRGAIDVALNVNLSADTSGGTVPAVTPSHVLAALKAYAPAGTPVRSVSTSSLPTPNVTPVQPKNSGDSELVAKVRELGLQARLALLAMLLASRRITSGLPLSGSSSTSAPSTPSRSPIKRSQSFNGLLAASLAPGMDATQLYAYYSALLTRSDGGIFSAVSRSEFGDLLGVLETVGLVTLSSSAGSTPHSPSKSGRRSLVRATSFNMGPGKRAGQDVSFVGGMRTDELARGLGLQSDATVDVREEEVRAIWERESARIAREGKACQSAAPPGDLFDDAMEG